MKQKQMLNSLATGLCVREYGAIKMGLGLRVTVGVMPSQPPRADDADGVAVAPAVGYTHGGSAATEACAGPGSGRRKPASLFLGQRVQDMDDYVRGMEFRLQEAREKDEETQRLRAAELERLRKERN